MTPEQFQIHQSKQNDLKQFIQLLIPLSGVTPNTDPDVQKLAVEKLKELIPMCEPGIKESIVKPLSSLQARA